MFTTSENAKNVIKIFFLFKWCLLRLKTPRTAWKFFSCFNDVNFVWKRQKRHQNIFLVLMMFTPFKTAKIGIKILFLFKWCKLRLKPQKTASKYFSWLNDVYSVWKRQKRHLNFFHVWMMLTPSGNAKNGIKIFFLF